MTKPNTTYKPLGDYIRKIDKRNRDLSLTKPMGINIDKQFMPSVANVIGTDMSNYKLVEKNQFACNLMHVGRDGKIPVAINKEDEMILVSPAYHVFEIVDENILSPDFLMMWFHREEFDREASFYTDADVRSGMDFKALTEMRIPVPPISEQRAVVADYEAVARRIAVAKRTIATLQATAQTLYRKMFVDGIDKENLPEGWRWGKLGEVCEINTDNLSSKDQLEKISYLDSSSVTENEFGECQMLVFGKDEIPSRAKRKVKYNDIVYSTVRPNLKHFGLIKQDVDNLIVSTGFAVIRSKEKSIGNELIYMILADDSNTEILQGIAEMSKATYPSITSENIMDIKFPIPDDLSVFQDLNIQLRTVFDSENYYHIEIKKLTEIQSLLLAGMGK